MPSTPWRCEICKSTINDDPPDGYIELVAIDEDGQWGGHPIQPTTEPKALLGKRLGNDGLLFSAEDLVIDPGLNVSPSIGIRALHSACDPKPDDDTYQFGVERAQTFEQYGAWVLHLSEKAWMSKWDLRCMLKFWWDNREQPPPS